MRCTSLFMFLCLATSWASGQALSVASERPQADYRAGENAVFVVEGGVTGEILYQVRHNLRTGVIAEGRYMHDGNRSTFTYSFAEPTFVNVTVNQNGQQATTGATFSADEIGALADEPADFDAFWQEQKNALAQVPLNPVVTQIADGDYTTTYTLQLDQVDGRQVFGYVVVPDGPGPFPASLRLPPFGEAGGIMQPDITHAERYGCLAVGIAIHNAPASQQDPNAYQPDVTTDPEQIYYRYAVLAAMRALDYITTRTDWDGETLCVYGDSQGGGLSMLTAGIDGRVTHLITSIGALSQHGGRRADRPSGFPYYLEKAEVVFGAADQDRLDSVFAATKYYDAVFAARRFAGPSMHFVNYLDDVCPPATAYAAYNEMSGPRIVMHTLDAAHNNPEEFNNGRGAFLRQHVAATRTPPWPWPGENRSHYIDAGVDATTVTDSAIALLGAYGYNQLPGNGNWPVSWSVRQGPGQAQFSDPADASTTVSFPEAGEYILQLRVTDPYDTSATKFWTLTDELVVNVAALPTSSLRENTLAKSVRLAPNPVRDVLAMQMDQGTPYEHYRLVDVSGRIFAEWQPLTSSRTTVDVSLLAPGYWVVELMGEGRAPTRIPFVKE